MGQHYDVIVIGGGHNGLVNAAYLALRAGLTSGEKWLAIFCGQPGGTTDKSFRIGIAEFPRRVAHAYHNSANRAARSSPSRIF